MKLFPRGLLGLINNFLTFIQSIFQSLPNRTGSVPGENNEAKLHASGCSQCWVPSPPGICPWAVASMWWCGSGAVVLASRFGIGFLTIHVTNRRSPVTVAEPTHHNTTERIHLSGSGRSSTRTLSNRVPLCTHNTVRRLYLGHWSTMIRRTSGSPSVAAATNHHTAITYTFCIILDPRLRAEEFQPSSENGIIAAQCLCYKTIYE